MARDIRDLRDPQILGERLLSHAPYNESAHKAYDSNVMEMDGVPDYPGDYTSVRETIEAYKTKMQLQTLEGNAHALRVLLDHEWPLPPYVPEELLKRALSLGSPADEILPDAPINGPQHDRPGAETNPPDTEVKTIRCFTLDQEDSYYHPAHNYVHNDTSYKCPGF